MKYAEAAPPLVLAFRTRARHEQIKMQIVELMLQAGAAPDPQVMAEAVLGGSAALLQRLVGAGVDPNSACHQRPGDRDCTGVGSQPLHQIVHRSHMQNLESVLLTSRLHH